MRCKQPRDRARCLPLSITLQFFYGFFVISSLMIFPGLGLYTPRPLYTSICRAPAPLLPSSLHAPFAHLFAHGPRDWGSSHLHEPCPTSSSVGGGLDLISYWQGLLPRTYH